MNRSMLCQFSYWISKAHSKYATMLGLRALIEKGTFVAFPCGEGVGGQTIYLPLHWLLASAQPYTEVGNWQ